MVFASVRKADPFGPGDDFVLGGPASGCCRNGSTFGGGLGLWFDGVPRRRMSVFNRDRRMKLSNQVPSEPAPAAIFGEEISKALAPKAPSGGGRNGQGRGEKVRLAPRQVGGSGVRRQRGG